MTLTRAVIACLCVALGTLGCDTDPGEPPPGPTIVRLEKVGGDEQAGVVGAALPQRIEVRVVDADGRAVAGRAVDFEIYSGGGDIAPSASTSDQNGVASATWTLGTSPLAAHQVTARVQNVRGGLEDIVSFVATAQAGPAFAIAKVSGDLQAGRVGQMLSGALVVSVHDRFGNAKPMANVLWTVLSGGGSLSVSASRTDGAGRASARFTLGPEVGMQTVQAALNSGPSVTFTLRAFEGSSLEGVIERTDLLSSRPYAVAISSQDVVYVTQLDNQRLSRINLPTLGEAGSVRVGSVPTDVSFNAAGTRAYVANQFSRNIGVVDVATNTQVSTIPVIGDAFEVIPDAEDVRLYVVTNADQLYQIDRATGNVLGSVPLPGTGQSLAWHPNGHLLYVSTFTGGRAFEVDTRSMSVTRSFITGGRAQEVVVSQDGTELFLADQDLGRVDVFSLATGQRVASIPVTGNPWAMALTPDQRHLYVSLVFQGEVVVIERASRTVVKRIATGGVPRRIVFDAAGTIGVIANESGYVTYIR